MTKLDFYKRHFQAVHDECLTTWSADNPKLIALWNIIFQNEPVASGAALNANEVMRLALEFQTRIDGLTTADAETGFGCLLGCTLQHEPGEYEIHHLRGGFDLVFRSVGERAAVKIARDQRTGDEVTLAELS